MDSTKNINTNQSFDVVDKALESAQSGTKPILSYHDVPGADIHQQSSSSTAGKAIDVDSFANLLMRGVASPAESEQSSRSSFTLPSFGISDPCTSSQPPSQLGQSNSRRESAESNDMKTPMTIYGASRLQESRGLERSKAPPPPPKSRHGKTLTPALKGPQTVAFDAFDENLNDTMTPRSASDSLPAGSYDLLKDTVSVRNHSHSSLSLPLSASFDDQREKRMSADSTSTTSMVLPALGDSKKAAPPPVPLARRTTVTRRGRANTASSNISQTDDVGRSYAPSITESVESSYKPAPPPPRRIGSSSTIPNIADVPDDTTTVINTEGRGTLASVFRERSNSGASLTSAPPRPPARRRSSRQSTDMRQNSIGAGSAPSSRRTSTDIPRSSFDSGRWLPPDSHYAASIAEEDRGTTPTSNPVSYVKPGRGSIDVLADMEAFQREIDAMRAKSQ